MENRYSQRLASRGGGQEVAEPIRTCLGCRARRPQRELVRISVVEEVVRVSGKRREPGRGAYICPDAKCVGLALAKDRLARALRHSVGRDDLERLARELADVRTKEEVN